MSILKIPSLQLFKGKRKSREHVYQSIQREGLTLLQKTTNKQLLADIKTQLYLQTYQKGLHHFASPSKYKQQAQNYLKSDTRHQEVFLKALTLPNSSRRCPNCFSKEIEPKNKCFCETQEKRFQLLRSKSNEHLTSSTQVNKYHTSHQLKVPTEVIRFRRTEIVQAQLVQTPTKRQTKGRRLSQNKQEQEGQGPLSQMELQSSRQQQRIKELQRRNLRSAQVLKFRENLNSRQSQLKKLELGIGEQMSMPINLNELVQAKDSYLAKNRQILDRLERIVQGQIY